MTVSSLTTGLSVRMDAPSGALRGAEAAFEKHGRSLYRYFAVRTGGDPHLADDLMQQLWLQASRSDATVPEDQMEFWLRRIAANLIRAHWRRESRRPAHVPIADPRLGGELADRLANEELPPEIVERREVRDQLLLAITELPSGEQELIVAHYFHGQSFAELARKLGLSERGVEGRMYRARGNLREKLKRPA